MTNNLGILVKGGVVKSEHFYWKGRRLYCRV